MKNKKTVLILIAVLAALLVAVSVLYKTLGTGAAPQPDAQGQTQGETTDGGQKQESVAAPDFSMTDAAGNETSYAAVAAGKPVILNFWTSWCGYCKQEMPDFEAAYQEYGDRVEFIMLDAATNEYTEGAGAAYIEAQGYTFPVYYDTAGEALSTYGVRGFPTTVAVGADGAIVYAQSGMLTADALQSLIDGLLAG